MVQFGIIAEGPTDQVVIENILLGYFSDREDEIGVNFVQPPRPLGETPAGWGHVFQSLQRQDCEKSLQFNDFVVIHIDTDVQEEPGFDVSRRVDGNELPLSDQVSRVIDRLKQFVDSAFYAANSHRILFAIAVDSIECWLLPLLYNDNRAHKVTGCLDTANRELRRRNMNGLSAAGEKFLQAYDEASSPYRKRRKLLDRGPENPSLQLFLDQLQRLVLPQDAR